MLDVDEQPAGDVSGPTTVAFEVFYRSQRRRVLALAYALTGSATAAEELSQDAFVDAFRRWQRISGYDDPAAWVRRVVVNRSVSRVRRRVAEARAVARLRSRSMWTVELDAADGAFWTAVRSLPARQAQVVALHYVDDCSIDGISTLLGIAPGTVKATLHQARRALAQSLGCDPEEDA